MPDEHGNPTRSGETWEDHADALQNLHNHLTQNPVPHRSMTVPPADVALARDMVAAYCANQPLLPAAKNIPDDLVEQALTVGVPALNDSELATRLHDMRSMLDRIRDTTVQYEKHPGGRQPQLPQSFDAWVQTAREHHIAALQPRLHEHAGKFRQGDIRANGWQFASAKHVMPLLQLGFQLATELPAGMARAIMLHLTWVEAHPFADGNGRTARLLSNDQLASAGEQICTHSRRHRAEIAAAYQVLRIRANPNRVIDAWDRTQLWSTQFEFDSFGSALIALRRRGDLRSDWSIEDIINNGGRTPEPTPLPEDE